MTLIVAYQGRGISRDLTILDADGNTITPSAADNVRVIIGREGEVAQLTVIGGTPTANGSSLTKGATNRLRLDASDLDDIEPGVYTLQFDYYDSADAQEWKTVDRQVFCIRET